MPKPIAHLSPHRHLTLAIDETGQSFGPDGNGRLVAVLGPSGHSPAGIPRGFHAAQASQSQCQSVLEAVLAHDDLGVLGLSADQLPSTAGDPWTAGVLQLIAWTLLMIPASTQKLAVHVEEKGGVKAGEIWRGAVELLRQRLAAVSPGRAELEVVLMISAKDRHPLLAAADSLAHTWNGGAKAAHGLEASGLPGTCLFEGPSHDLPRCLDLALRPRVSGEDWRWLLAQPGAQVPGTPAAIALERLGERVDLAQWRECLQAAAAHLDGGDVSLSAAQVESAWLQRYAPENAALPPSVALTLATGRLAVENHRGETLVQPIIDEIVAHNEVLFEENPSLVCLADLHLAVQSTHRLDFEAGVAHLSRWRDLPVAVAGLRMRARVESSLGQLRAFQGRNEEAIGHFQRALEMIGRLSEPAQRERERAQTAAYLAIASMDSADVPGLEVMRRLKAVSGSLDPAAQPSVWGQYLVLRWLTHRPQASAMYQHDLDARHAWEHGEHHPWPLIEAYRALLLRDSAPDEALTQLQRGRDLALREEAGPVLWLQGVALSVIAHGWGERWDGLGEQLAEVEYQLPGAREQVEHLRRCLEEPLGPVEVLRGALPFNFR